LSLPLFTYPTRPVPRCQSFRVVSHAEADQRYRRREPCSFYRSTFIAQRTRRPVLSRFAGRSPDRVIIERLERRKPFRRNQSRKRLANPRSKLPNERTGSQSKRQDSANTQRPAGAPPRADGDIATTAGHRVRQRDSSASRANRHPKRQPARNQPQQIPATNQPDASHTSNPATPHADQPA
jgi:hypothetical protein